jgi:hypothetical protein
MRHPPPPYPREDEVPAGSAWTALLPGQPSPIDEATTEVPVITPATGQVADTSTNGESTEVAVDTDQAAVDGMAPDGAVAERTTGAATGAMTGATTAAWPPEPAGSLADAGPPGLKPGDVAQEPIAVWPTDQAQHIRDRWRDLQVLFIDEPDEAVAGARSLVTEAVRTLSDRLLAEQEEFDPRRDSDRPDTEALRIAMRRYREFLDRVLSL